MRVAKAKRRWMKWARYVARTGSVSAHKFRGGYHSGYSKAYVDLTRAHRYPPIGVRHVSITSWMWTF